MHTAVLNTSGRPSGRATFTAVCAAGYNQPTTRVHAALSRCATRLNMSSQTSALHFACTSSSDALLASAERGLSRASAPSWLPSWLLSWPSSRPNSASGGPSLARLLARPPLMASLGASLRWPCLRAHEGASPPSASPSSAPPLACTPGGPPWTCAATLYL